MLFNGIIFEELADGTSSLPLTCGDADYTCLDRECSALCENYDNIVDNLCVQSKLTFNQQTNFKQCLLYKYTKEIISGQDYYWIYHQPSSTNFDCRELCRTYAACEMDVFTTHTGSCQLYSTDPTAKINIFATPPPNVNTNIPSQSACSHVITDFDPRAT